MAALFLSNEHIFRGTKISPDRMPGHGRGLYCPAHSGDSGKAEAKQLECIATVFKQITGSDTNAVASVQVFPSTESDKNDRKAIAEELHCLSRLVRQQ